MEAGIPARQEPLSQWAGPDWSDVFRANLGRLEPPGLAIPGARDPELRHQHCQTLRPRQTALNRDTATGLLMD